MGANRTRFLANRRLQPLGHLSGSHGIIPELSNGTRPRMFFAGQAAAIVRNRTCSWLVGASPTPDDSIAVSVVPRGDCW